MSVRDLDRIFSESASAASGSYVVDSSFIYSDTAIGDVLIATGDSGVARQVCDAVGQRVLRVDPDGSKTLYLGATELRWEPGSTAVRAARSYPGGVRREFDGSLTYLVGDHQGSVQAAVDAGTGAVTFNRQLPYGGLRQGALVDDKGFLGQTHDPETTSWAKEKCYGSFVVDAALAYAGARGTAAVSSRVDDALHRGFVNSIVSYTSWSGGTLNTWATGC